eukprot:TRINITY_DN6925_c0_g1_i1.p1 TRINITY_DN6925_c0_g1~~TRINITY_DN6925_c0_g1_i1.p1  ORF type:complete len:476 (+),score=44.49 TRINITY_DN6925_c0_g1_i1:53-1429(+)
MQREFLLLQACLASNIRAHRPNSMISSDELFDRHIKSLHDTPFRPFISTGKDIRHWAGILEEDMPLPELLKRPKYETIEVNSPWKSGVAPIVQCSSKVSSTPANSMDARLQDAVNIFCDAGLDEFVKFYVDPDFQRNYDRLQGSNGWIDKAFVSYMGVDTPHARIAGEEDLLAQSLNHFSKYPFVLAIFNGRRPLHMTPEHFPNLVIMHGKSTTSIEKSFNFNKLTTMLFTKVGSGVALDADQFANRGIDSLLERVGEETTDDYPFPIMPVHWMSRDPRSSDMKSGYPAGYSWTFVSADAPKRTMRWGHAHPSWSYQALPWLAKWTSYALAPNRTHPPKWLVDQGYIEDEDLLNVGMWADGARKQWCKYDITAPEMFKSYLRQDTSAPLYADSLYYPKGIALVYSTAHDAKHPGESYGWLKQLWEKKDDHRKGIYYDNKWFGCGKRLRKYDPKLRCIV